jgi:hypothetical protein
MILSSNCGYAEWGEVFGDPVVATALLDRLLHHTVVIQIVGSSDRLRQHAISCQSTSAPKPASTRQSRHNRRAAAVDHQKMDCPITTTPADHRKPPQLRNFT